MKDIVKSFTYGENINERTAVKFSQEGIVVSASEETDNVCGIALFTGIKGAKGDILLFGLGKVATSEEVNAGDLLVAGENGKLKVLDTETENEAPVTIVAKALESASSAAHINALVNPQLIK